MQSAKQPMRSRLLMPVVVAGACWGCTQMPPAYEYPPLDEPSISQEVATTAPPAIDVRDVRFVRAANPGESAGARRASLRPAGGLDARVAAPARGAQRGVGARARAAGILHANQAFGRARRAKRRGPVAAGGPGGGRVRGSGWTRATVDGGAAKPDRDGEPSRARSSSLDGSSSFSDASDGGGLRASALGAEERSASRARSEEPPAERKTVRGARTGDNVSEMTRFVRPEEPRHAEYSAPGRGRLKDPFDLGTVFSDPALLLRPSPEQLRSWTRCGHGRF